MATRYIFRRKFTYNDIVVVDAETASDAQERASHMSRDASYRLQDAPVLAKIVLLAQTTVDDS